MAQLGVNIDHVATLRQARKTYEPDPVQAAYIAELAGADLITIHLREDRRHIQERDLRILRETVTTRLNLELSCDPEVVKLACLAKPDQATVVPERREEVTTEGGLNVAADPDRVARVVESLRKAGIEVSLFIDPVPEQVAHSAALAADSVELHTGSYALAIGAAQAAELERLVVAGQQALSLGMRLHAGHGLNYHNVIPVARIAGMCELNIGHSIVSRAVFTGLREAVAEMKRLISSHS